MGYGVSVWEDGNVLGMDRGVIGQQCEYTFKMVNFM
jgi:hypothetical protein